MTTIGSHSHVDSPAVVEIPHRLVHVFVAAAARVGSLQGDFHQSSYAGVYSTFPARCFGRNSPSESNMESLRPLIFSITPTQLVLHDACSNAEKWGLSFSDVFQQVAQL